MTHPSLPLRPPSCPFRSSLGLRTLSGPCCLPTQQGLCLRQEGQVLILAYTRMLMPATPVLTQCQQIYLQTCKQAVAPIILNSGGLGGRGQEKKHASVQCSTSRSHGACTRAVQEPQRMHQSSAEAIAHASEQCRSCSACSRAVQPHQEPRRMHQRSAAPAGASAHVAKKCRLQPQQEPQCMC